MEFTGYAPPPLQTPIEDDLNSNNINDSENNNNNNNNNIQLIESKEFEMKYKDKIFKITIGMSSDYKFLCVQSKEKDDVMNNYEIIMSLKDLVKFDKQFRICEDIKESYLAMLEIFNCELNKIKEIVDNKLIIVINILKLDKSYRETNIVLYKKKINQDEIIDILSQQINELKEKNVKLEDELNLIKNENKAIEDNFNNYKNEVNQEINILKETIKKLENNSSKIDSNIICNRVDYNLILRRLKKVNLNENQGQDNQNANISFKLLYRASKDGDEAKTFHSKCDGIRNTLVIVLTKKGLRFGGFTSETWEGNDLDKKDLNAFCFSLDLMKIYNSIKGKSAIYASPNSGPAFQNCIFEIKDNCFKEGGLCSDESASYYDNHEKKCEINGEEEVFNVEEVEVFSVLFN